METGRLLGQNAASVKRCFTDEELYFGGGNYQEEHAGPAPTELINRRRGAMNKVGPIERLGCRELPQGLEYMVHPEWPEVTVAEVLEDERLQLMPDPKALHGFHLNASRTGHFSGA
jgi:hypothetical protein